jgi:hypothetical protein
MKRSSDSEIESLGPPLQTFVDQSPAKRPIRVRGGKNADKPKTRLDQLRRLFLELPLVDRLDLLKDLLAELSREQLVSLLGKLNR